MAQASDERDAELAAGSAFDIHFRVIQTGTTNVAYHVLVQDYEAAARWAATAIAQRDGAFPFGLQMSCARGLRASAHWPALARLMNRQ